MDGRPLVRMRWRLRGAWMWPTYVVLTVADGILIRALPLAGDSGSVIGGCLIGAFAGLLGIILLAPPLGYALRRVRPDLPRLVARDYAGTATTVLVTAAILAIGALHHHVVSSDAAALRDATARAEAYIGEYAPGRFQNLDRDRFTTYELQPPRIYRVCAQPAGGRGTYCVVVRRDRPFGQGVRPAGSEPNGLLSAGTS